MNTTCEWLIFRNIYIINLHISGKMSHAVNIIPGGNKFVVAVPHSGDVIPVELEGRIILDQFNFEGYDLHSSEIFTELSEYGPVVLGIPHREIIDYNRLRDDNNPVGGVLPEEGFHGNRFLNRPHTPVEREELLQKYWDPYQGALDRLVREQHDIYGHVLLIAGHTMEGVGPKHAPDVGMMRPDLSIGTLDGTLADKIHLDTFIQALQEAAEGLDVKIDYPYNGSGFITKCYGKPNKGLNAIQIEVNTDSYEDPQKQPLICNAIQYAVEKLVNVFHL